jgi:hypothetical protein
MVGCRSRIFRELHALTIYSALPLRDLLKGKWFVCLGVGTQAPSQLLVSSAFGSAFFCAFACQRGIRGERCLGDMNDWEGAMLEMTVYFLSGTSFVIYGHDYLKLLKLADELAASDFDRLETRDV